LLADLVRPASEETTRSNVGLSCSCSSVWHLIGRQGHCYAHEPYSISLRTMVSVAVRGAGQQSCNQTVWLAKALPREWLAAGAEPVVVEAAPSRYGRITFRLAASQALRGGPYAVKANVSLPPSCFGASGPAGGVRLRLRAPVALAGKLVRVTVGGKPWRSFDPVAETIDFSPTALVSSSKELRVGLQDIVAEWERA
jgi:hypothetical protein